MSGAPWRGAVAWRIATANGPYPFRCLLVGAALLCTVPVAAQHTDSLARVWTDTSQAPADRTLALYQLCITWTHHDLDSAIAYGRQLVAYTALNGNDAERAKAWDALACALNYSGRHIDALAAFDSAWGLAKRSGNAERQGSVLNNRGMLFQDLGQHDQAARDYLAAAELGERDKDTFAALCAYGNLGILYGLRKDYPTSITHLERTLAFAKELKDDRLIAQVLHNIGATRSEQGELPLARQYLQNALQRVRALQDSSDLLAGTISDLGSVLLRMGIRDSAEWLFRQSLGLYQRIGDVRAEAAGMVNIGSVRLETSDARGSIQWCSQALTIAEPAGLLFEQQGACECLSKAYEQLGRHDLALHYYKAMTTARDSLVNQENIQRITRSEMQFTYAQQVMADSLKHAAALEAKSQEVRRQKVVRNGFIGGFALVAFFAAVFLLQRNRIGKEKKRSDELLLNILPEEVAEELKDTGAARARHFDTATILFTDFKGFTQASERMTAEELVEELNTCFKAFDHIITERGIEKIKTIGDAYMCAGGLPDPNSSTPADVVHAALEMQAFMRQRKAERAALGLPTFEMRVGIHSGPVVAGIVGVKKFQYDIWGDTVNTASRLESSGEVGRVNISEATYALVKDASTPLGVTAFTFTPRGKVQAKGKGELEMYFVEPVA